MTSRYNPIEWHRTNTGKSYNPKDSQVPVCRNCGHLFMVDTDGKQQCEYCGYYGLPTTLGHWHAG